MKKIFSVDFITIIGEMCYSIYLLHFAIISAAGSPLLKAGFPVTSKFYFPLYALLFISLALLLSAVYFVLVEKPFMKPFQFLKRNS